jgi:hypothetical protein
VARSKDRALPPKKQNPPATKSPSDRWSLGLSLGSAIDSLVTDKVRERQKLFEKEWREEEARAYEACDSIRRDYQRRQQDILCPHHGTPSFHNYECMDCVRLLAEIVRLNDDKDQAINDRLKSFMNDLRWGGAVIHGNGLNYTVASPIMVPLLKALRRGTIVAYGREMGLEIQEIDSSRWHGQWEFQPSANLAKRAAGVKTIKDLRFVPIETIQTSKNPRGAGAKPKYPWPKIFAECDVIWKDRKPKYFSNAFDAACSAYKRICSSQACFSSSTFRDALEKYRREVFLKLKMKTK